MFARMNKLSSICSSNMLHHHLQFWKPLNQGFQYSFNEDLLTIKHVDIRICYLAVNLQRAFSF